MYRISLTTTLLTGMCSVATFPLPADDKADAEKIDLKLKLKQGDIRNIAFEFHQSTRIETGDEPQEFKHQTTHSMRLEVEDVDDDGKHTVKVTYLNPERAGNPLRMKVSPTGDLSEISVLGDGFLKKQWAHVERGHMGHMGFFAVASKQPVAIGDSWMLPAFESGVSLTYSMVPGRDQKLTAAYTLSGRKNGEATVTLAGEITDKEKRKGVMAGSIVVESSTGWPIRGQITAEWTGETTDMKFRHKHTIKIVEPAEQQ